MPLSDVVSQSYDTPFGSPEVSEDHYWADRPGRRKAELEANPEGYNQIACEISEIVRNNYDRLDATGVLRLYHETVSQFYSLAGGEHVGSQIIEFGEDGEKLGVVSNQMRSLLKFVHLAAVQAKPALKPRAINNTPEALAQIPTARRLIDYYDRVKKVEIALRGVALRSLIYGRGFLWQSWDPSAGPLEGGRPQGDLIVRAGSPLDTVTDLDVTNQEHDWVCFRLPRNRYDLVATYAKIDDLSPEGQQNPALIMRANTLREQILGADKDILKSDMSERLSFFSKSRNVDRDDTVFEYHFMHRRTPALPGGRYTIVLPGDIVLWDGDLPYDELPVDEMCPEEFLEMGGVGYASAWDLLGMQQCYDSVLSTAMTNHDAFGHNDILIPEGVDLGYEELRDGLNVLRYPIGEQNKPSMLEKLEIKESSFKLKDWLKGDMELVVSVNSVARGEPEKSLESGSALALVQAQAINAQSLFVQAYMNLLSSGGTKRIRILQKHLDPERVIAIAGSDDPDSVEAFQAGGIALIDRIEAEAINPLFQTIAGRQNAADKLLERQLIKSAGEYMQFLETGRLEMVTDDQRRKDLFGRRVREILMRAPTIAERPDPMTGQPVQYIEECRYLVTDDPRVCLAAASSVLDSFANRNKPEVRDACLAYMSDVLHVWRNADPALLLLLGYPSAPALAASGPIDADGEEVGGPDKGPKGGDKGGPGNGAPAEKPVDQQAPPEGSSMPSLPKPAENPL